MSDNNIWYIIFIIIIITNNIIIFFIIFIINTSKIFLIYLKSCLLVRKQNIKQKNNIKIFKLHKMTYNRNVRYGFIKIVLTL